ncbi:hypothetical protein ACFO0M_01020 [Micromonospora mangrovi]|uniref:Uncharacterized protein n=2 Tax=Micromonospora TaxID=1873 RepID=A0AAU7MDF4_9ACTN
MLARLTIAPATVAAWPHIAGPAGPKCWPGAYGNAPQPPTGAVIDLPPGVQIGLGHPTHAFAVHIADDGGYLHDPTANAPTEGLHFDFGGVPTEYPAEHLQLRPETAIQLAVTFLKTGGEPPHLAPVTE